MSSERVRFGECLQQRYSYKALLAQQTLECTLLEQVKRCIAQRVAVDRAYANSLQGFVGCMRRVDTEMAKTQRVLLKELPELKVDYKEMPLFKVL